MGWGGGYGMGWGGAMPFGGIGLLLLVLAAGAIVLAVRASGSGRAGRRSSGLDLLDERYARGEIERDEYLRRKRDIADRGASA